MLLKSIVRKAGVTITAAACAGFFAASSPAFAQYQVLGASPPVGDSAPQIMPSKQLVLHGVRLQGRGLSIAPSSRPVLDYAVQTLERYPETLVYVSGQGDSATVQREAEAVARYLEQRGIPANRLVLANPTTSRQVDQRQPTTSEAWWC
ncbi:MAG: ElyC/SanA/YdcF family protein [Candidatus Binataceae bacterium]